MQCTILAASKELCNQIVLKDSNTNVHVIKIYSALNGATRADILRGAIHESREYQISLYNLASLLIPAQGSRRSSSNKDPFDDNYILPIILGCQFQVVKYMQVSGQDIPRYLLKSYGTSSVKYYFFVYDKIIYALLPENYQNNLYEKFEIHASIQVSLPMYHCGHNIEILNSSELKGKHNFQCMLCSERLYTQDIALLKKPIIESSAKDSCISCNQKLDSVITCTNCGAWLCERCSRGQAKQYQCAACNYIQIASNAFKREFGYPKEDYSRGMQNYPYNGYMTHNPIDNRSNSSGSTNYPRPPGHSNSQHSYQEFPQPPKAGGAIFPQHNNSNFEMGDRRNENQGSGWVDAIGNNRFQTYNPEPPPAARSGSNSDIQNPIMCPQCKIMPVHHLPGQERCDYCKNCLEVNRRILACQNCTKKLSPQDSGNIALCSGCLNCSKCNLNRMPYCGCDLMQFVESENKKNFADPLKSPGYLTVRSNRTNPSLATCGKCLKDLDEAHITCGLCAICQDIQNIGPCRSCKKIIYSQIDEHRISPDSILNFLSECVSSFSK